MDLYPGLKVKYITPSKQIGIAKIVHVDPNDFIISPNFVLLRIKNRGRKGQRGGLVTIPKKHIFPLESTDTTIRLLYLD